MTKPDTRKRSLVLAAIRRAGPDGLNVREACDATGLHDSTVGPRLVELLRAGLIRASGQTRLTRTNRRSAVYVAAPDQDDAA